MTSNRSVPHRHLRQRLISCSEPLSTQAVVLLVDDTFITGQTLELSTKNGLARPRRKRPSTAGFQNR
jgi:hypothetical protein